MTSVVGRDGSTDALDSLDLEFILAGVDGGVGDGSSSKVVINFDHPEGIWAGHYSQ